MGDRLISIEAGTPQWDAWLKHYRGTKNEMRMLDCRRQAQSFRVVSEWPPDAPRPDHVRPTPAPAPIEFGEHRTPTDGEVDAVADRLAAVGQRHDEETAEQKKRRKLLGKRAHELEQALEAARFNQRPALDQADDYDAIVDPNEAEELVLVGKGPPMRIKRLRPKMRLRVVALRDDPIGQLAKRHMLGHGEERDDRLLAAHLAGLL
jgi:hypothetical protein